MKQTAVEFIESKLFGDEIFSLSEVFEQAKQMEKQQQDEFAIGFMNWCIKNYHVEGIFTGILDEKELLNDYKKEQGL